MLAFASGSPFYLKYRKVTPHLNYYIREITTIINETDPYFCLMSWIIYMQYHFNVSKPLVDFLILQIVIILEEVMHIHY